MHPCEGLCGSSMMAQSIKPFLWFCSPPLHCVFVVSEGGRAPLLSCADRGKVYVSWAEGLTYMQAHIWFKVDYSFDLIMVMHTSNASLFFCKFGRAWDALRPWKRKKAENTFQVSP